MKNSIVNKFGVRTDTGSSRDGTSSTPLVTPGISEQTRFVCVNGNVHGDKKSPNPINFQRVRNFGQRWSRYSRYSGYPYSYYSQISSNTSGIDWSMSTDGALFASRIPWASIQDRALQRVYDQMRYGSGNLVVDLAESRQTIQMIRNATSVRKIAKSVVKSVVSQKRYSAKDIVKHTSDKWLEYRYGWLPFVSSTYELLKTLSKEVDKRTIAAIEGRGQHLEEFNVITHPNSNASNIWKVYLSARHLIKCRMRARTTLELYDFTSLNPAGIAWELVPLSFVADWFVNVGDCLRLWEDHLLFANRFVDGFRTITVKERVDRTYYESAWGSPPLWPNGNQKNDFLYQYTEYLKGSREVIGKDRAILYELPSPGGVRLEVKLNSKRLLDAAALIRTAFGNR